MSGVTGSVDVRDGSSAAPVFVDVDTGVDDAMALAYLLASDDADIVGIASTAGNVPVDQVCANNLGLLEPCAAVGRTGVQGRRTAAGHTAAHRRGHPRPRRTRLRPAALA